MRAPTITVIVLCLVACACSTQKRELPGVAPAAPQPSSVAPAPAPLPTPQPGMPAPQKAADVMPDLKPYQGEVKLNIVEGNMTYLGILSKYPCKTSADCTSTKYGNAPAKKDDCTCQAPCTPYVANKAEAAKREAANKKLCGVDDWFGVGCPAPACSFIDFVKFVCHEGKCAGAAMGKN